jgi:hypothetical protein
MLRFSSLNILKMKKLLLCYLLLLGSFIQVSFQNLNTSETIEYINKKLIDYQVKYTLGHDYLLKYQISLVEENLIVTENNQDFTSGDETIIIDKVKANNLMSNAFINKNMHGENSLVIQIDCKNGLNNVEDSYTTKYATQKNLYRSITINVGANEENTQYLCNAFNHLIDLLNESGIKISHDPFAEYPKKELQPQQETSQKSYTSLNKNSSTSNSGINYKSFIYRYNITVPKKFRKVQASEKGIDMAFITDDGTSIAINVSPRLPEEYSITAHSYSKESMEKNFKESNLKTTILETEKIYFAGNKAFKMISFNPLNLNQKTYEIYFFKDNNAYVLSATTILSLYNDYEKIFIKVFDSFWFE